MKNSNIGKSAVILSGSMLPAAYLTGMVVGQIYKHYNSAGVDINSGLAYLRQILISSFTVWGVVAAGAVIATVMAWKQGDRENARLAVTLLLIQLLVFVILFAVRAVFPIA